MFKLINKTDQSNLNDSTIRHQSFRDNFNQIHIFQLEADLILNAHFIDLVTRELRAGRFSRNYLIVPLSIYVYDNNIKSPYMGELKKALMKWGINDQEIQR